MPFTPRTGRQHLICLYGDYVRSGTLPDENHILIRRLYRIIGNPNLLMMHMRETDTQFTLLEIAHGRLKASGIRDTYSLFNDTLAEFDMLHSVVHGLFIWIHRPGLYTAVEPLQAKLVGLQRRSHHLLHCFVEDGLSFTTASEILTVQGRELVDRGLKCYHTLPHSPTEAARSPEGGEPDIARCFKNTVSCPPPALIPTLVDH